MDVGEVRTLDKRIDTSSKYIEDYIDKLINISLQRVEDLGNDTDKLAHDVAYTNLLVAKTNLMLAKSNLGR